MRTIVGVAAVASLLSVNVAGAGGGSRGGGRGTDDPAALAARVHELERQNAELMKRLERLERVAGGSTATPTESDGSAGAERPAPAATAPVSASSAAVASAAEPSDEPELHMHGHGLGLGGQYGGVRAALQVFGDAGFEYRKPPEGDVEETAFAIGSLDFFTAAQAGEHFQSAAEIVVEGDSGDNEVHFELERLLGTWTFDDALYLKLGREHSPASRWNRRYHHGKWLWTSATQPFLARFEDDGGPLQVHQVGIEAGGRVHAALGALEYVGAVSNGRGRTPGEVTNFGDRNEGKAFDVNVGLAPALLPALTVGGNLHFDEIPSAPGDPRRRHGMRELLETAYLEYFAGPVEAIGEVAFLQHDDRTSGRDFQHRAGYLQLAYRFDALTPFTRGDVRDMERGDPFYEPDEIDLDGWEYVLGVRYDLNDYVAVKLEGGVGREERPSIGGTTATRRTFQRLTAQLAWIF